MESSSVVGVHVMTMGFQREFNEISTKKNTVIQLTHVKPYLKNDAAT
jgi:hypothetical protein